MPSSPYRHTVVNCFQNLVPLVSATTELTVEKYCSSCELLSEFSTFGISNNFENSMIVQGHVVNCFQNLVPLVSATTPHPRNDCWMML